VRGLPLSAAVLMASLATGVSRRSVAGAPIEASVSIGGAVPLGALEAGSSVRDVSFGVAPVELALSYVHGLWGATVSGSYGISIPTLCGSSSECLASLGRDVTVGLFARYDPPRLWRVQPTVSIGLGYEWFRSKLEDGGATSSRSFHGIVLPIVDAYGGFGGGHRWRAGPFLRASAGRFTGGTLQGAGSGQAELARDRRWHEWVLVGFRISLRRR
jgi:hypothetical protein